ncbi:MAG: metallophosphoesterase family protein [Desulfuromonadales bacterium]|jgi:putative phosphoesterase|nr:metallophosphoesterase family protein [Desulfuromonadales bacterium]
MMKLGIISDTHLTSLDVASDLALYLLEGPFAGVDAILHAGDMVIPEFIDCFYPLPCYAVQGNMDQSVAEIPFKRVIGFGGKRIGLIHGWGPRSGLEKRVMDEFAGKQIDCLVYGHSHYPVCRQQGDLLLFNPGSPVDRRSAPKHTVGLLTIDRDGIRGEIVGLD